jgi:hypothetical protein
VPLELELQSVLKAEGFLFLRYRTRAGKPD